MKIIHINIRFNEDFRYDENVLFNQPITFKNQNTGNIVQVPISSVTETELTSAFSSIKRKDLKRVITIYSNVLEGYNGNAIVEQLQNELQSYELPQEYDPGIYRGTGKTDRRICHFC